jgi:hypothetical protein
MKRVKFHIRGQIDEEWADWFDGLEIVSGAHGTSILQGEMADASAIYGLIAKLRDLGLELLSIEQTGLLDTEENSAS